MITLEQYLMGRDKIYPLTIGQLENACKLLCAVNWIIGTLKIDTNVSSGYRPLEINSSVGGAKFSTHLECAGVDLFDESGKIGTLLVQRKELLKKVGLYLENPSYTKKKRQDGTISKWVHLDIKVRSSTIFNP